MDTTFTWETATPESQNMDATRLDALWMELAARQTSSLLVVRNDRMVYERYAAGWDGTKPHYTASLAKALVGGLSLLLALDARLIGPDDRIARYVPQWRNHPQKAQISVLSIYARKVRPVRSKRYRRW